MSHDIRTPMNAILGYAALARKERELLPVMEYVSKIESSGRSLMAMIDDVLQMSLMENGEVVPEPAETDLAELAAVAKDMFRAPMEQKEIRFTVETELKDAWVLCDALRLQQLMTNLLSNACKFTPRGGEVFLSLRQTGGDGIRGSYEVLVRDNGIGMSPEFTEKVYEAFERERSSTESGVQGTGLGMTISKHIVDLMGGQIRLQTEQGKGTVFTVALDLPLAEQPAQTPATEETAAGEPSAPDFSGMRVLLVEDIEINREIASMLLEEEGFQVDTAENGQIALDMVASAAPGTYKAVLMDIQMPVMNGYEAASAIRALEDPAKAGIPIVAVTANAFEEDVRNAMESGMDGLVPKPLEIEKLLETLAKLLPPRQGG